MVHKVKTKQVIAAGAQIERVGQVMILNPGMIGKVGGTAGWVVRAAGNVDLATLPASQTGSKLIVPITGLKVGQKITEFFGIGQIESGGNAVTLDMELRKQTAAAADVADATVASMTQLSVTADTAVTRANATKVLATPEVVAADSTYYLIISGTTLGATDVALNGIGIVVTDV